MISNESIARMALLLGLACGGLVLGVAPGTAAADDANPNAGQNTGQELSSGVVNINTASAAELTRLPGVGPSRAAAIVAQRERRPFRRVEEIMRVRGIGRATFRELRGMLTVEGPTTLGVGG